MTLVSDIITNAYREGNVIAAGKSPSVVQMAEGLSLFNSLVKFLTGGEAGETLKDWPLGNYGRQALDQLDLTVTDIAYPPINARLIATAEIAKTIYLPVKPSDGSRVAIADPYARLATYNVTLDGNGRTIESAATQVLSTNSLYRSWFYRADLSDWKRITDLVEADEAPFPEDFDDMLAIMLMMRLSPRTGRNLGNASLSMLKQTRTQFIARYSQSEKLTQNADLSHNTIQSYNGFWDTPDEALLYGYR